MVLASRVAHKVAKGVLARVVGVDGEGRIRLLKLAAHHCNTLTPGGGAAVAKSPGRNIGEHDKDSMVGRMLDGGCIVRRVAGHEVARVDLAVR